MFGAADDELRESWDHESLEEAMARQREKLIDGVTYGLEGSALTELRLNYSLCPVHAWDYAICFDDENPECAQVRAIHPEHDS